MEKNIKPGDFVVLRGEREVRKVLDVRIIQHDNGCRERVLKLEGILPWIPEKDVAKVHFC